ncbi:MAG: hypothetical protein QNJ73_05235 [Gammaproteobacteria bacterium]|nr:hypothetical protein [Gammaproteobacteria bacterium]
MCKSKNTSIGLIAALLLAVTPASHAQTPENLEMMQAFLQIMTDYFGIIEATHAINSDPEKAAIMQMQKIQEVYEERGEKARAVEIIREVLNETRNPTIRNAAIMMLGDNLKETGRSDQALEILRQGLSENIANAK